MIINQKERNLINSFSEIPTNLKPINNLGFVLEKNGYNTFNSIYFSNKDNSYTKLIFQKEKEEKFNILIDYNSSAKIDSTETKHIRIGNKMFDYYSFIFHLEDGNPIKMTSYTSKIKRFSINCFLKNGR